jgi:hypothetical protein
MGGPIARSCESFVSLRAKLGGEDVFNVEAIPSGNETIAQINGPRPQGLLEERFKLKLQREIRNLPCMTSSWPAVRLT